MNTDSLTTIATRLARLPADRRTAFRQALQARGLNPADLPIVPRAPDGDAPLSFAQQRLWFLDQMEGPDGAQAAYNICTALRLTGTLHAPALKAAFEDLLARHAALRTAVVTREGRAVQQVVQRLALPWQETDLSGLSGAARDAEVEALARALAEVRFDLAQPPLMRLQLARLAADEHILWLTLHHVVADGWSLDVLVQELGALYGARTGGAPAALPALPIEPADHAAWQREMQSHENGPALAYWTRRLGGEHPLLALPADHARPARQSHRGGAIDLPIPGDISQRLRDLAQRRGKTLFTVVMAAFHALLYRYTGQRDIRVGTPVANRDRAEVQGMVGLFLNTLVLRSEPAQGWSFDELLEQVAQRLIEAQEHQELPFEQLVDALQPARELSHAPLFQAMLIVHAARAPLRLPGLQVQALDAAATTAKFDLTLEITDTSTGGALDTRFNYATDLFDAGTIGHLAQHWVHLLRGIVQAPHTRLDDLPLLSAEDRHHLLHACNATEVAYPQGAWVHELFEQQATRTPDAPALFSGEQVLSYRELNRRSNQLAHELRSRRIGPDAVVGVCLSRSVDMVVALLGVMKAGGAYLPLDPDYPEERLDYMLAQADARLLLTHPSAARRPRAGAVPVLDLSADAAHIAARPVADPGVPLQPQHLAYVIYTSGSTGRPKGVAVPHEGLLNRLQWMQAQYPLQRDDRILQKTPFSFDVSVWEFFWPLMTGAGLVVAPPGDHRDSQRLIQLIRQRGVTTLHFVPSMLRAFLDDPEAGTCACVRRVICSGEALPHDLQQRFFSLLPAELHNLYGPTEASIDVSHWACLRGDTGPVVPIGRPIANTRLLVLDAALNLVPVGVAGELHIGGVGLARGYLGRPELTAERFIPDPHAQQPGQRLYRTGDLARVRRDGAIEYLGRIDHQVKIRGFRIELGEIEARLQAHAGVAQAVVVAREDRPGDKRLVAYWVAADAAAAAAADALRAHLLAALPEHMVPGAFVQLPAMPLSSNGKLDRKALPAPQYDAGTAALVAPRDEREQLLAGIWQDVLGLPRVGVHDNFFRLGGDSILSLQVVAKARRQGLALSPRLMFEHQTIAAAAAAAPPMEGVRQEVAVTDAATGGDLPLTPIQHWFFDAAFRVPGHWNQALVLEFRHAVPAAHVRQALQALVQSHAALRLRFTPDRDHGWRQHYRQHYAAAQHEEFFEPVNLGARPAAEWSSAIEAAGAALQQRLDLQAGPLLRAAWFEGSAHPRPRLLIAVHHLAVDGVSWRVLLDDLQTALEQQGGGRPIQLPAPSASYRQWAQRLSEHVAEAATQAELPHWLETLDAGRLPLQRADEVDTVGAACHVRVALDAARTQALLGEAPARWRARVDDLLLAALAGTLCAWSGQPAVLVELEGHGREDVLGDIDVSRTVGWFTTRFPVRLAPGDAGPVAALKAVKEQLRRVPRRGIGYGLLRYLADPQTRARLAALPQPEVCFNYLGRFDRVFHADAPFTLADGSPGGTRAPHEIRSHALDVDAQVLGDTLAVDWTASPGRHEAGEVERLAARFIDTLAALLDALRASAAGATPADFPLCRLSQQELDALALPWQNIEDLYPLAPMQHGLLLHTLMNPGSGMYLMQDRYRLQGEVDEAAFVRAWEQVIERHAVLRTSFHWRNEAHPLQAVHRRGPVLVSCEDWSGLSPAAQRERLDSLLARELREGFDLSQPALIRFRLIYLGGAREQGQGSYYFTQSYHHILIDAWCFSLLMVDFFAHYRALLEGRVARLPQPRPYADFIAWLAGQDLAAARAYWARSLAGFDEPTPLGIDKRPGTARHTGVEDRQVQLDEAQTAALQARAQDWQITVNTCTQAAWALLLSWYSGRHDVLFGITVAGRPAELEGVENSMGLFINTLPLRLQVAPGQLARDWLRHVLERNMDLRQYEHLPLSEVQGLGRTGHGRPLFDSLFVFENAPVDRSLDEWKLRWRIDEKHARTHTNYPLTVVIIPGERLTLQLTYDSERFDEPAILRMLAHFKALLLALLEHPQARVGDLPLLGHAEQARLAAWNDTGDAGSLPTDGMALFAAQVRRTPDAVAARCLGESLTYAELDRRAGRICRVLVAAGIGPDDIVALHDRRGLDLLAMILGVLQTGAAYLPLDPLHPAERLAQVLGLSQAAMVLSGHHHTAGLAAALAQLGPAAPRHLPLSGLPAEPPHHMPPPRRAGAGHLAYVIYTSGSTGVPKGAMVERRGMFNNLLQKHVQLGLQPTDVVAQTAPACFDISVWQFLSALLCGASIDIVPDEVAHDPAALLAHVRERGITVLESVPGLMRGLLDAAVHSGPVELPLRWLLPTGEALPPELARQWLEQVPSVPLLNVYGPAECADDVALHALRDPADASGPHLPIGRPVANLRLYVMNQCLEPLPVGVPGELCIAGVGVGRGYLHDPVRTAAAFVPHPGGASPGERLYCTGDLVRQREDGVYEYLGRIDHQVKLRGHRIELGEIESRLEALPGVAEAAAIVREDRPGDQRLVAYVAGPAVDPQALGAALERSLPRYMVPSAIVTLTALPRNANGKLDRRALPAPGWSVDALQDEAPADETQALLARIWADVLGLEQVGIRQDFFALGGHSLLATQVVSRIRRQFGVDLPLRAVFDAPTVQDLARELASKRPAEQSLPAGSEPPAHEIVPLAAGPRRGVPLSFAQERLWFLSELQPGSPLYNMPVTLQFTGALDIAALERALAAVQERHEVLRSVIERHGDAGACLRVLPAEPVVLPLQDLGSLAPAQRDAVARQEADAHARRPFDLGAERPWRARLLRLDAQRHWLLLNLHHIAGDGWSLGVWMRELAVSYPALRDGAAPALPLLTLQYADVAAWQRRWLTGPTLQRQLDYWRERLGDVSVVLELPTDRPRPPVQAHRGASLDFDLEAPLVGALRQRVRQHGATLYMGLLTAFSALLHRYSGQDDIRIGTPVAGRHREEFEPLIGLFANTLVLRSRCHGDLGFADLLRQVRETVLEAQAHQDLPFERLVQELQPQRDLSRSPLFQVMFILQNMPLSSPALPGLQVDAIPTGHATSKFDLTLIVAEDANRDEGGQVQASIEYDTDLFDHSTIQRMAGHFASLLRRVVEAPDEGIGHAPLLDDAQRRQILVDWNRSADPAPFVSVAAAFEAQARRQPLAPALVCAGAVLSYGELDRRANALAHRLRDAGLVPDDLVGVCLPRSPALLVALLAVCKAGAAYLPLDPGYPAERLERMLEDARPRLVLAERGMPPGVGSRHPLEVLALEGFSRPPRAEPPVDRAHSSHLAYCIYTSGSTGRPKGVEVTRGALCNLLRDMRRQVGFESGEMLLAVTSLSFDIAALELYLPLTSGGTVLLATDAEAGDAGALLRLLREHPVGTMQATPATWQMLLAAGWGGEGRDDEDTPRRSLKLLCGGESLSAHLAQQLQRRCTGLWNVYGPTETTIWSTLQRIDGGAYAPAATPATATASPLIGRPIANTTAYVLDRHLAPVPPGVAGELYLGGDGLARGYRGRADLTAERFIPSPFGSGERLYRTGDLARWMPDGSLQCLGRGDRQIKLRGFRIELDEVEAALAAVAGVKQAAVVVFGAEDKELVGFAVPLAPGRLTDADLRAALSRVLPGYMVPTRFMLLDALPLTPNGKLDRKALPRPQGQGGHAGRYAAPADAVQALLSSVWEDFLGVARVGVHDNFFHLGGHSLLAVRVMLRVRQLLQRELPLTLLFKAPTVGELAQALQADGAVSASPLIALRASGRHRPLFCLHPAGGHVAAYLPLVQGLAGQQPVYGLQSRRLFDPQWRDRSIAQMACDYADAVCTVQPRGPYQLLGWSLGGMVAQAMAAELERRGETVAWVGLIDTARYQGGDGGADPDGSADGPALRHHRADEYLDQLAGLMRTELPGAGRLQLRRSLVALPPEEQLAHLLGWAKSTGNLKEGVDIEEIELQVQARDSANRLMRAHRVEPVAAPLHLWWAEETLAADAGVLAGWDDATRGGVHHTTLKGSHWDVVRHPGLLQALCSLLKQTTQAPQDFVN